MITYTDEEKSAVIKDGSVIPRGHHFWSKRGIDTAEAAGEILPFVEDLPSKKDAAKATRDAAINSNIEVLGVLWDIDGKARDNINEAINSVNRQPEKEGDSRYWILADNSVRPTTASDLRQVMNAYTARLDGIYAQYGLWLSGDMSEDFTV